MPRPPKPPTGPRPIETLVHADSRRNIPTAEFQSIAQQMEEIAPFEPARYKRATPLAKGETRERNADLDPQIVWRGMRITLTQAQRDQLQETGEVELGDAQLVWRGKDTQDWSDLVVNPPPIYIQEKVQPKAIIEGIRKESRARAEATSAAPDLFADFNGLDDPEARLEFYQHDQHWSNRMILGDSLQVMASLAEREGLRGQVQCIYFDPPYGIRFNSNWQVSTQSRDVKDGKREDVSREPEQVKAFRDTWKDGINSYLTYLRDRLTVARELLSDSGSMFVQIGDENVHRVRAMIDEVFGARNFVSQIVYKTTSGQSSDQIAGVSDYVLWFAKNVPNLKYRQLYHRKVAGNVGATQYDRIQFLNGERRPVKSNSGEATAEDSGRVFAHDNMTSQRPPGSFPVLLEGKKYQPNRGYWKTGEIGFERLKWANRIMAMGNTLRYIRFLDDFAIYPYTNLWDDTVTSGFDEAKAYVVQTNATIMQRCILMATDPGDLVLDPTCGSGTTATVGSSGAADGSQSTPPASPWLSPAPGSWRRDTPTISWQIAEKVVAWSNPFQAESCPMALHTTTSAKALSTNAHRT